MTTFRHTKIRILIACVSFTIVFVSSVYNLTAIFATRNIIIVHHHEMMIVEESRHQLPPNVNAATFQESTSKKKKLFHSASERKFDKRDAAKKNEIQSWNEIEQALSQHNFDANETDAVIVAADRQASAKTAKKKSSHPKHRPKKSADKATERRRTKRRVPDVSGDTTIVITTNWMPSVPSTAQLDKVISSLVFLHGLPKDAPMIIAVDGAYETGARYNSVRNVDMRKYVKAIRAKYDKAPHVQIMTSSKKIMLVRNMKRALRKVDTKYVLALQHDLPFINQVNYTGLMETMETHSEVVRLVRFPTARVLTRNRDGGVCKETEVDFESIKTTTTTGIIKLTKTHVWSDRNHLTRKSYYDEMFQLPGWNGARTMEFHMQQYGTKNCSYWGSYLYGERGSMPTIFHMDGRRDGQFMTSTKRIYGNLTGLL